MEACSKATDSIKSVIACSLVVPLPVIMGIPMSNSSFHKFLAFSQMRYTHPGEGADEVFKARLGFRLV